jgi:hypothetical protein
MVKVSSIPIPDDPEWKTVTMVLANSLERI